MWHVSTFYKFLELKNPEDFKSQIINDWAPTGLRTLIILAKEGINSTIAAEDEQTISDFKKWLETKLNTELTFKNSHSEIRPFRKKMTIKVRDEIVTIGRPDLVPASPVNRHLSAEEWDRAIEEGATLVDTRNIYETEIGTFKGALIPPIKAFSSFGDAVDEMKLPKEKKILIFCTGGIRCEKAILEMQERGYENVYQLNGGILKYFEDSEGKYWNGECFVFDGRVAVDKKLNVTTKYGYCPLCGDPAEQEHNCHNCSTNIKVCGRCIEKLAQEELPPVCSKNCRHQQRLKRDSSQRVSVPLNNQQHRQN